MVGNGAFARSRCVGDEAFDSGAMGVAVVAGDILFGAEFHEEDDHYCDKDYGWWPRINCPVASHTNTSVRANFAISWVKETVVLLAYGKGAEG